jgi:hypothetical protein
MANIFGHNVVTDDEITTSLLQEWRDEIGSLSVINNVHVQVSNRKGDIIYSDDFSSQDISCAYITWNHLNYIYILSNDGYDALLGPEMIYNITFFDAEYANGYKEEINFSYKALYAVDNGLLLQCLEEELPSVVNVVVNIYPQPQR